MTEIKWSLRQDLWKKTKDPLKLVIDNKCIFMPYYTKCSKVFECIDKENGSIKEDKINLSKRDRMNFYKDMKQDDHVIIFENGNNNNGILVKIKSECKIGIFNNIIIYKNNNVVNDFGDNIIQVSSFENECTKEYTDTEKMWAIYRNIEFIKEINFNEAIFKKYYKFQGCLIRNRHEDRIITLL